MSIFAASPARMAKTQRRYVIKTPLRIGDVEFRAEISLADRSDMRFPMLIGRSSLRRRFVVDSGYSWLQTPEMKVVERPQTMKIAMLARNPSLYSHRRLQDAPRIAGTSSTSSTRCAARCISPVTSPKCFTTANRASVTMRSFHGSVRRSPITASPSCASSKCAAAGRSTKAWRSGASRDKLRSMQILAKHGLGLPLTAYANDPKQAEEIIKAVKGPPVVIKLLEGTQGIGVVLAETMSSAKSVIEAFRGANVNILVQEFIKEAGGTDIRALVVGGKVVAAMKRTGAADDFRSNLHRGGGAQLIKITPEERSTAVRAAKRMGLNVCGVVIMEVLPGLHATGKDIAGDHEFRKSARDGKFARSGRRGIENAIAKVSRKRSASGDL